jgi:hypothetical protein
LLLKTVSAIEGVREVICEIDVTGPDNEYDDREIEKQVLHSLTEIQHSAGENSQSLKKAEMEYWQLFEL